MPDVCISKRQGIFCFRLLELPLKSLNIYFFFCLFLTLSISTKCAGPFCTQWFISRNLKSCTAWQQPPILAPSPPLFFWCPLKALYLRFSWRMLQFALTGNRTHALARTQTRWHAHKRARKRARFEALAHTRTHAACALVSLQVHQACCQRFQGIWRLR